MMILLPEDEDEDSGSNFQHLHAVIQELIKYKLSDLGLRNCPQINALHSGPALFQPNQYTHK